MDYGPWTPQQHLLSKRLIDRFRSVLNMKFIIDLVYVLANGAGGYLELVCNFFI